MDYPIVHLENKYTIYRARDYSCARICRVVMSLLAVLIPIPIIFATQGLWKKTGEYWEQPEVFFTHKYLVAMEGEGGGLFASTLPAIQGQPNHLPSRVESSHIRNDNDKIDRIDINIQIFLPNITVNSITYVVLLDMSLSYREILQMETAIMGSVPTHPSTTVLVTGALVVDQLSPLSSDTPTYSIIDASRTDIGHLDPSRIATALAQAPLSLHLHRELVTTHPLPPSSPLQLAFALHIPQSHILYRTGFFELLKWGWIQYLAVFVITYWLSEITARYLFENRIIHSIKCQDK